MSLAIVTRAAALPESGNDPAEALSTLFGSLAKRVPVHRNEEV
jgi:hypothetical protein